jgi:hypothetical protein
MTVTKEILFQQVLFCYNGDLIYILPFHVGLHSKWLRVTKSYLSEQEFICNHHITSSLLKNAVFWDVVPCRSSVNRRFGGTYRLHLQSAAICSGLFLARGLFYPEVGGDTFLGNVDSHKIYMAPHPRIRHSS